MCVCPRVGVDLWLLLTFNCCVVQRDMFKGKTSMDMDNQYLKVLSMCKEGLLSVRVWRGGDVTC